MSLADFHKWVKEVLRRACEEALLVEGFVPDPIEEGREGKMNGCLLNICFNVTS